MAASKRPSTSSLRRFITSRPYVTVAELRRRFGLDDPDAMSCVAHDGRQVYLGLPEREATKIADLLGRGEIGLEMSVEVRAPVAVGVYPIRIARYIVDGSANGNGMVHASGHVAVDAGLGAEDATEQPLAATASATPSNGAAEAPSPLRADELPPESAMPGTPPSALEPGESTDPSATNGHGGNGSAAHARDGRSTRHNGRRVPLRHRRHRFHRARPGPGPMPGDAPSQ